MRLLGSSLVLFLSLVSCGTKDATPAAGPRATITLRDGTTYTGKVTANTPAQITLVGDDNQTRTLNVPNVKSIEYSETPAPQPQTGSETPHPDHDHPDQSAIQTKTYVVPAGKQISVRTEETIDSKRAARGQTFAAVVTKDVADADGAVVIPHGANAQIVIRAASPGGRIKGRSELVLDLESVSIDGQQYSLETKNVVRMGKQGVGANRRTAKFVGGGAAIGAVIGVIAGRGKGAAIGAASGAGAGFTGQVLTRGPAVRVPVESVLTFRLEAPLSVTSVKTDH